MTNLLTDSADCADIFSGAPLGELTEAQKTARLFVDAGFAVIPLLGKVPKFHNWQNMKPNAAFDTKQLTGNYGVVLGDGDLVIDVDPRNFPVGAAISPLQRLLDDIGGLPPTFTVRTGGGGVHLYLKKPAGIKIVNGLALYPGIEFKSTGRQVVGPKSIHPDTKKLYEIAKGTPAGRANAPDALVYLIMKKDNKAPAAGLEKYTDDEQAKQRFTRYLKNQAPTAQEGNNGDITTFKVACRGRDYGLSPDAVIELMRELWNDRCNPPWELSDLGTKVRNAYVYNSEKAGIKHPAAEFPQVKTVEEEKLAWVLNKNNSPVRCFVNALNFLKSASTGLKGVFGYNEFTGGIEFVSPAPWHGGRLPSQNIVTDDELKRFKAYLAVKHAFEIPVALLDEVIVEAAHLNAFHPVREYVQSLEWDGVKRLDTWLSKYGGATESCYSAAVGRKTITAMVARVVHPGCKFDYMPVLEGRQGIGKSRLCAALGGEWFGDLVLDPHSRDTVAAIQGKWVIEMAEMEVTKRAETQALKAFLTRTSDKARLAFQRLSREFPRQCVFIGTINPESDGYLKDQTGNRRFWPIYLTKINVDGLRAIRHQLIAEAYDAYRGGERLYLDGLVEKRAAEEASFRMSEHPWTERVIQWLNHPDGAGKIDFLTPRTVFIHALGGTEKSLDRMATNAISGILMRAGWEKKYDKEGNATVRGFRRPRTREQIETEELVYGKDTINTDR